MMMRGSSLSSPAVNGDSKLESGRHLSTQPSPTAQGRCDPLTTEADEFMLDFRCSEHHHQAYMPHPS